MAEIKYITLELLSKFKTNADALYATKSALKEVQDQLDGITGGGVVTGVKGSAEAEYRKGQVEITAANIGLDKVENTADAEKVVASAGKLTTAQDISITGGATAAAVSFDGTGAVALNVTSLDATKISGVISIDNLPAAALERLLVVDDEAAMLALTEADVQVGDTVQIADGLMYRVVDVSKLGSMDAFRVYTAGAAASVPWSGVTDKPETFAPSAHTHVASEITDFAASVKAVKVDAAVAADQVDWSGVQNKPETFAPSAHGHAASEITGLAAVATSGAYADLTGVPTDVSAFNNDANYITAEATVAAANKLTVNAGASNKPVYFAEGVPVECGFTVETSVPANAVFTDTTYEAATAEAAGLMSAADKAKLDSLVAATEAEIDALFA